MNGLAKDLLDAPASMMMMMDGYVMTSWAKGWMAANEELGIALALGAIFGEVHLFQPPAQRSHTRAGPRVVTV